MTDEGSAIELLGGPCIRVQAIWTTWPCSTARCRPPNCCACWLGTLTPSDNVSLFLTRQLARPCAEAALRVLCFAVAQTTGSLRWLPRGALTNGDASARVSAVPCAQQVASADDQSCVYAALLCRRHLVGQRSGRARVRRERVAGDRLASRGRVRQVLAQAAGGQLHGTRRRAILALAAAQGQSVLWCSCSYRFSTASVIMTTFLVFFVSSLLRAPVRFR